MPRCAAQDLVDVFLPGPALLQLRLPSPQTTQRPKQPLPSLPLSPPPSTLWVAQYHRADIEGIADFATFANGAFA